MGGSRAKPPWGLCRGAGLRGAFRTWKKSESQRLQSWLQASVVTCDLSSDGFLSGHPLCHQPPSLLSPGEKSSPGPSGEKRKISPFSV